MSSTLGPRRPDRQRSVLLGRRLRRTIVGATLVVMILGAATATALRPPPGDPPEPPEIPPPTTVDELPPSDPPPPPPPPPPVPREVQHFVVTADSVVATAEVGYLGTPAKLIVYWGDNTATELTPPPAGSVTLRHEYAPQPDGRPFDRIVTVNVSGESDARLVRITPRYLVTQHEAQFEAIDNCEPGYELESEWDISRWQVSINGQVVADEMAWEQTKPTNVWPNYEPLESSAVQAELTAAEAMTLTYVVEEDDFAYSEEAGTRWFFIQPDGWVGTEWTHLLFDDDSDCEARISANITVALVRPGI